MQIRLTTTGRQSGEPRSVSLYAWPDGDDGRLVVVGSWAGRPRDPSWAVNLRAHPDATVKAGKREWRVVAREVGKQERDRLWDLVVDAFPLYATYQKRTTRQIPLFVLESADV